MRGKLFAALTLLALLAGDAVASRNSAGTYSLPAGNPVITLTTISSTWANTTLSDIGVEITNSLDRNGRGAMLAPLQLNSGAVGAPGLTWGVDLASGFYRIGALDYGWALNGTKVVEIDATTSTAAVISTASGTNQGGAQAQGSGTGYGVNGQGGSTSGIGGVFAGGNPNGKGLTAFGIGVADGIQGTGGSTSGNGGTFSGGGSGVGVSAAGGGSSATGIVGTGGTPNGKGIEADGTGSGVGLLANGGSSNANGITAAGGGTGAGISATGGATGIGVIGTGGASGAIGVEGLGSSSFAGVAAVGGSTGFGVTGVGGAGSMPGYGTGPIGTPGGQFANGTSANASAREDAISLANGDLDLHNVANPNSSVGFVNRLSPSNLIKAWGFVTTAGSSSTSCTVNAGFNVSSCAADAATTSLIHVVFASGMASSTYAVMCTDATANLGVSAWYSIYTLGTSNFVCSEIEAASLGNCYANICKMAFIVVGLQ